MKENTHSSSLADGFIKLLTPKDIQRIFSMGKNQAYALMHSAGFPSIMVGSRIYVEESHLKKWIDTYSGRKYIL